MIIRLGGGGNNTGVQEFGVKGHLGVIFCNSSMLTLLHSCPAIRFRHALRYQVESWHGGQAHKVCGHIFEATPPGVIGHEGVNLPYKCPMATKFGEKNA